MISVINSPESIEHIWEKNRLNVISVINSPESIEYIRERNLINVISVINCIFIELLQNDHTKKNSGLEGFSANKYVLSLIAFTCFEGLINVMSVINSPESIE